jgi:hypothetical protein
MTADKTYDKLADLYDSRYDTPMAHKEDEYLFGELRPWLRRTVLDVGAGTGLLLDMVDVDPSEYHGVEPSLGMATHFRQKHPEHYLEVATYETSELWTTDTIVSLYGSPSYINPESYLRMRSSASNYFLMFYKEGYLPDYDDPSDNLTSFGEADWVFRGRHDWHNWTIYTNTGLRLEAL